MSMTYQPKIEPVLSGDCLQTIRKGRKFSVGDEILLHGWSGRPYRSPWSWRKRVTVIETIRILISKTGIAFPQKVIKLMWSDGACDRLAAVDFIDPPTGEALWDVLFGLNGAPDEPQEYQIIRW